MIMFRSNGTLQHHNFTSFVTSYSHHNALLNQLDAISRTLFGSDRKKKKIKVSVKPCPVGKDERSGSHEYSMAQETVTSLVIWTVKRASKGKSCRRKCSHGLFAHNSLFNSPSTNETHEH